MTAFYRPLKLQDGGWHYTRGTSSSSPYPIGYCCTNQRRIDDMKRKWEELDEMTQHIYLSKKHYDEQMAKHLQFLDKYHWQGHETADDAIKCYHQYLVDQNKVVQKCETEQHKCQFPNCNHWTQFEVYFRGEHYTRHWVCNDHQADLHLFELLWRPYERAEGAKA